MMANKFRYLGMTVTNENFIHKEIKSRLNFGNAYCHLVQNILTSHHLPKNLEIKTYRTIVLPVFFCMSVKFGLLH